MSTISASGRVQSHHVNRSCSSIPSSSAAVKKSSTPVSDSSERSSSRKSTTGRSRGRPMKRANSSEMEDPDVPNKIQRKSAAALSNLVGDYKIHVGKMFQATVPKEMLEGDEIVKDSNAAPRDQTVWSPPPELELKGLNDFIQYIVKEQRHTAENVYYLLHENGYDYKKTYQAAKSLIHIDDEWSEDDKAVFRDAFIQHGKNFTKVKEMLPHHSRNSIIDYYYRYKLHPQHKSYMEAAAAISESADSDSICPCIKCGIEGEHSTLLKLKLCDDCIDGYRQMNVLQHHNPADQSTSSGVDVREYTNEEMLRLMSYVKAPTPSASAPSHVTVRAKPTTVCQAEIEEMKKTATQKAAECSRASSSFDLSSRPNIVEADAICANFRTSTVPKKSPEDRWTQQEEVRVICALARHGTNFPVVTEYVSTKSMEAVQRFYQKNKEKLDMIINHCRLNPSGLNVLQTVCTSKANGQLGH